MKKKDYRIAFFGTPKFAADVLEALSQKGVVPTLIVTAPDKPRGRGRQITPSPAKEWAGAHGIDVLQPEKLKDESFLAELGNSEWDVFIVAAYAKLIPPVLLSMPRKGVLNVHPSLLPKFRGPSPVLSAILADERQTGVSIMLLDEEMDHGPVISQARIEIPAEDWPPYGSVLEELLATEGGNLLAESLEPYMKGDLLPEAQDHAQATVTRKFSDEDARIVLAGNPRENFLKIRAFDAGPRAYMLVEKGGRTIRVLTTEAQWEDGMLRITKVLPEGKKEMDYAVFEKSL